MMRGQRALEAMRRRGRVPDSVFIDVDDSRLRMADDWQVHTPALAMLSPLRDKPSQADLRCVVGLTVFVSGADLKLVHAMRDACIRAQAARVIATTCVPRGEVFDCIEVSDTEGKFTWPE